MKETEFFSKAQTDPLFRQQKLEESAYQKKTALAVGILYVAIFTGYFACCEIFEQRWPSNGAGIVIGLVLCAWSYTQAGTRLGALQAMPASESNPANRGGSSIASGARTWTTP